MHFIISILSVVHGLLFLPQIVSNHMHARNKLNYLTTLYCHTHISTNAFFNFRIMSQGTTDTEDDAHTGLSTAPTTQSGKIYLYMLSSCQTFHKKVLSKYNRCQSHWKIIL